MKDPDLITLLCDNPYPGRGIVLDSSPEGKKSIITHFIMGRNENSRSRVLVETPDGIRTQTLDPSKMADPSLIIYTPVWVFGTFTIVTNGDQTDTIREGLAMDKTFAQALHIRTSEPDAPGYIPRTSGLVKKNGDCTLSILKSVDDGPASCRQYPLAYGTPCVGQNYFIHIYMGNGTPSSPLMGEPEQVETSYGIPVELVDLLWNSLNAKNKVSLFVRYIDRKIGDWETVVENKHTSA